MTGQPGGIPVLVPTNRPDQISLVCWGWFVQFTVLKVAVDDLPGGTADGLKEKFVISITVETAHA
jgi:hypothetical protein